MGLIIVASTFATILICLVTYTVDRILLARCIHALAGVVPHDGWMPFADIVRESGWPKHYVRRVLRMVFARGLVAARKVCGDGSDESQLIEASRQLDNGYMDPFEYRRTRKGPPRRKKEEKKAVSWDWLGKPAPLPAPA
jgi:hypothetical protein